MASGKMTSVNVPVELSRTLYIQKWVKSSITTTNHYKPFKHIYIYVDISWYIYYKLKQNWHYFHRLSVNWGTSLYQEPSRGYANIPHDIGTSFGGFGSRDGSVLISFWWKPNKKAGCIFVPVSNFGHMMPWCKILTMTIVVFSEVETKPVFETKHICIWLDNPH